MILERHVRKSRLRVYEQAVTRTARHVLARLLGRDHLNVHLLHLDVAASVVRVVMRINHISDRLVGDLLQLRHDAVVVDRELIVHKHHAFVGDERGRVAGDEVVVDDIQVILDLD